MIEGNPRRRRYLIANLPTEESKHLYRRFTEGVGGIIHKGTRKIKKFCFDVSPYLIGAYRKYAISCHFIGSTDNEVGKYFSYSDASIQRMIREWDLKISTDQCKIVSAFGYNNNHFVNPYLRISYMKSVKENGACFQINLSPPSLRTKCIFEEQDLKILYQC